ncbi:MAG: hypothetical protein ACD_2C00234G0002 [uncultured bacterium (gcode 4)]|uniref:Phospho-N-acetylmuramoyl-pentapeptide-transferase n=1 Tax=uncultured bacterium (gcode 4) TaxID=1234023 RepID=K2GZY0_9BACT|nr:MAG: hypothetical protein ACD_2C00234G0002 [uncultured bacterium (gcode 4)]
MWNIVFLLWYLVLAFMLAFAITPIYIKMLYKLKLWKQIREEGLIWKATEFAKLHAAKTWTPTMWGWMILWVIWVLVALSILFNYFWADLEQFIWYKIKYSLWNRNETYLPLFTLFTVWMLWLVDDYMNVRWIWRTKWISAKFKMLWLITFWAVWAYWFYFKLWHTSFNLPFFGNLDLWLLYIPIFIFIIISMANAVNITDWLDWLAWGLLMFNYFVYSIITYNQHLFILSALCMIVVWTLIAFLWFNIKPAKFYMWDVWALALWANLWIIAMMTNTLIVLVIISWIYIIEIVSVIIQLTSKKLRKGKKVFKIAPFHHHLEAIGWKEESVVMRFWLVGMILSSIWVLVSYLLK